MTTPPQRPYKISLIGDDCIDEYQYGNVERLSAEAPVPVLSYNHSTSMPGMAANVRENLQVLGCDVRQHFGATSRKIRILDEKSKQHICRIDHDVRSIPLNPADISHYCEAIVISDYNKGTVDYQLIKSLRSSFLGPIFVDSKKPALEHLEGCFVKINEPEYNARTSNCENLIVTRGSDSVWFFPSGCNGVPEEFPVKQVQAFDVCGAGDTFLAALACRYVETSDIRDAIKFAIKAASVTVQHIGVYAPTLREINEA